MIKLLKISLRQTEKIRQKQRKGTKMLRGVNRQVIEISETDCEYFERVMFFVKPECAGVSEGRLRERANAIAGKADKPPMTKLMHSRLWFSVAMAVAAGLGAGLTAVITAVLS